MTSRSTKVIGAPPLPPLLSQGSNNALKPTKQEEGVLVAVCVCVSFLYCLGCVLGLTTVCESMSVLASNSCCSPYQLAIIIVMSS